MGFVKLKSNTALYPGTRIRILHEVTIYTFQAISANKKLVPRRNQDKLFIPIDLLFKNTEKDREGIIDLHIFTVYNDIVIPPPNNRTIPRNSGVMTRVVTFNNLCDQDKVYFEPNANQYLRASHPVGANTSSISVGNHPNALGRLGNFIKGYGGAKSRKSRKSRK